MTILLEHATNDRGKVTAGLSSLSPERRRDITEYELQLAYQHALQQDYKNREEQCTEPDGSITDVTDWNQVIGIPLMGPRIISRLRKLNRNLWFEPSIATSAQTGIYILQNDLKGGLEKHFLCGIMTELNPEYSLRVVDHEGKPKGIIPGWRRALMRLIRARLITEAGAWSLFGPPSRDSENWARFTT